MSLSLLERLRAALAPQYEVERELGAGGMGTIFLARDVTLKCDRAVKILRPELATATAAERFLREARILASLSHPNVVTVHSAGEVDGLFYYVMDHIEGETVAERLERGPLSQEEAVRLGGNLLSALEAAHSSGVIHRDVKPANIFLVGDRALLGDFGVAKPSDEDSPGLTAEGHQVGTPVYMAPEQVDGSATPRSDLYAAGMIVYEALTGVRWSIATPTDQADWSGVPGRLTPVLRRALALAPADRWEDAAAFREALTRPAPRARTGFRKHAPIVAPLVIIAAIVAYVLTRPGAPAPPVWDLAILPVQVYGWDAPIDGAELASMVTSEIVGTPGVSAVHWRKTSDWWESAAIADSGPPETRAAAGLGARKAAFATLTSWGDGDSVQVELELFDDGGDPLPGPLAITVTPARPQDVSKAIALALVRLELDTVMHEGQRWTDDLGALQEYQRGQRNFERGRGRRAVEHFQASVARDSTFAVAWWRLANAWRWLGEPGPYEKNYQELFDNYAADLGVLDSMLMAVQLTPAGPERLRRYWATHERFPLDYFAAFLHGEELFNRGPLWGEPLESAVAELEEAVRLNEFWALAYVHLIWANIRLGHEEEARRYLEQLVEHAPDPEQSWSYPPELFRQAIRERFAPEEAGAARLQLLQDSEWGQPEWVARLARLAGAFDVPRTQVELGGLLLAEGEAVPRSYQAAAHLARGLGLVGLGRVDEALYHFDAAAAIHDTPEARLLAAEWRVLPRVVALNVVEPAEVGRGKETLGSLVGRDPVGVRACWALALDAFAVGDTMTARRLSSLVMTAPPESGGEPLGEFLYSVLLAEQGDYETAIERSQNLLAVQTPTVLLHGAPSPGRVLSDPFARALLHIKRGAWFVALDQPLEAEREYLWYEAVDVLGLPEIELPQAGEIDWALGNWGRLLRGSITADRARACGLLGHVLEAWSEADPGFAEKVVLARDAAERACR
jgi:tRNA A-37 threonylcarbamoyl transferase component Bud32/tetratricopeptide (TPR) repeat protein